MTPVNFIQFPVVAVSVDNSSVLNLRVNIVHMLQTPEASTHSLRQWELFAHELGLDGLVLHWEEDWNQGEPDTSFIISCLFTSPLYLVSVQLFCQIINALKITAVSLEHERVYKAVELA